MDHKRDACGSACGSALRAEFVLKNLNERNYWATSEPLAAAGLGVAMKINP